MDKIITLIRIEQRVEGLTEEERGQAHQDRYASGVKKYLEQGLDPDDDYTLNIEVQFEEEN